MYVPEIYRPEDSAWIRRIMCGYPLATMVTNGEGAPRATHLPVVFEERRPGRTLLGHMNRANPHWASLVDGEEATLIFHGPHSYITPTLYGTDIAAPTWDFVAVHARGTLEPILDPEGTLGVVRRTVEVFESRFGDGWDAGPSLDYFREIGPGVGAFRFHVTGVDGMFKLSQEKEPSVRDRIIERLGGAESGSARDLGAVMRAFGLGSRIDA